MAGENGTNILDAVRRIPCGVFVLTSSFHDRRTGVLTRWVQPCSTHPPHIMVAVARGLPIEPLIRDSRAFALCQISAGDRLLLRSFATTPDNDDDPFVTLPSHDAPSGSPIIDRAMCYLDCELVRHVVLDGDHRLYVGHVRAGAVLNPDGEPAIELGGNGLVPKD
ncbi:MAG: flavin reductase family protein [Phycisphaerales bacterium]|nr:flavin reductase family protein [Phycisphaerae bacterium]NNF45075.1 flavin reductase family protein [Phycisphaerales bacterium]NNM24374.1 flavin reductase family protein [Phycisphaerales bacterium]